LDRMPLAAAVGTWVLRTAIAQAAQWMRAGTPIRVGVNLFAAQFRSGSLPERIAAKLGENNLPANLIEIELTETIAVKNSSMVKTALSALRQQGIGIALDDFGTGYASLSVLKELPVTRLKIDKSFVEGMVAGSPDAVVVDSILRMGQSFRLDVTAEGIETVEQQEWLKRSGCAEGQGYLYGRAMSADDLGHLIAEQASGLAA
ncbi:MULTISPECIES: EAL domain-containing protein, partial [unclassified Sphingomonas]|uniref:EAL domain-containing protein n=1 Tax=unclassified Sphingomonas TaxID=196159 RepID=UPI00226A30D4